MRVHQLLETSSLVPGKVRSYLLGKAMAATYNDAKTKFQCTVLVTVARYLEDNVIVTFVVLSANASIASMFKKRLKEVRMSPYSVNAVDKSRGISEHHFRFPDLMWEDFNTERFMAGWLEVQPENYMVTVKK